MHADETLWSICFCCQPGDRKRRRVGSQNRFRMELGTKPSIDVALDYFVLDDSFDHEVAPGKLLVRTDHLNMGKQNVVFEPG
jgi:hypothetical protein